MELQITINDTTGRVNVISPILRKHPQLNVPIGVKIKSGFIPEMKIPFNKWSKKHF